MRQDGGAVNLAGGLVSELRSQSGSQLQVRFEAITLGRAKKFCADPVSHHSASQ